MEKTLLVFLIVLLLFILVNSLNLALSKRKIRKEAKRRGWKIIKIRMDLKQTFLESFGPLNNVAFDVIYEKESGEIMNPNMYVRFFGLELDIEQNYPIARNQRIDT